LQDAIRVAEAVLPGVEEAGDDAYDPRW